MKKLLVALAFLAGLCPAAQAQNPSPAQWQGPRISGHAAMFYNSGQGVTLQDAGAPPVLGAPPPNINIAQAPYNAVCDDVTDDTAAINAAVAAVRAVQTGKLVGPSGKTCRINGPLNFTGLNPASSGRAPGLIIDLGMTLIDCHATGGICVDATNSTHITWQSINISGNATDVPKIGLQISRPDPNTVASQSNFYSSWIVGSFSQAAYANWAGEETHFQGGRIFVNGSTGVGAMLDCINYHGVTSSFVTISWPTLTAASCNNITFESTRIQMTNGQPALWFAAVGAMHVDRNSYFSTTGPYIATLFSHIAMSSYDIALDMHAEASPNLIATLFLTGDGTVNPYIHGLSRREFFAEDSFAEIAVDWPSGINSAIIDSANFNIFAVQPSVQSTYTVFGKYQKLTLPVIATAGAGCTNGAGQAFTVQGGTGYPTSFTGTVTGGVLTSIAAGANQGTYQVLPPSPSSISGAGCTTLPTVTWTSAAANGPFTNISGIVIDPGSTYDGLPGLATSRVGLMVINSNSTSSAVNFPAATSCAAGTVNATTMVVTNGLVTHC